MDYKTAGPYAVKNWDVEVKICYYLLLSSALPGPSWRYSYCPLTLLKINFWLLLPCYCVTVLLCITSCPAGWLLYSVFTSSLNASLDPLRSVAPTRWRESTEMFTGPCGSNWCNWCGVVGGGDHGGSLCVGHCYCVTQWEADSRLKTVQAGAVRTPVTVTSQQTPPIRAWNFIQKHTAHTQEHRTS